LILGESHQSLGLDVWQRVERDFASAFAGLFSSNEFLLKLLTSIERDSDEVAILIFDPEDERVVGKNGVLLNFSDRDLAGIEVFVFDSLCHFKRPSDADDAKGI
jgi:hypothetical protein